MHKSNLVLSGILSISVLTIAALVPNSLLGQTTIPKALAAVSGISYDIGTPTVRDYWISPTGNNSNTGDQNSPITTIGHAWELVPQGTTLQTGFRFHLLPGTYNSTDLWVENRDRKSVV